MSMSDEANKASIFHDDACFYLLSLDKNPNN